MKIYAAVTLACVAAFMALGFAWYAANRAGQPIPAAELARMEKEAHQRNAVTAGAVMTVEGLRAWRAARREKKENGE
jgi:cytosine/uracil/thiamine/allantoin permease